MNKTDILKKTNQLIEVTSTDNILTDLKNIIDLSQENAYQAINTALVYRNWLIGYRISEEELKGNNRADYGTNIYQTIIKRIN